MKHSKGTTCLRLKLSADNLNIAKWHVDALCAVHPDMKSHTGRAITLGHGCICNVSAKQKLNAKSSTELELAGVSNVVPQVAWTRCCLHAQGYGSDGTTVYQDQGCARQRLAQQMSPLHLGVKTKMNVSDACLDVSTKSGQELAVMILSTKKCRQHADLFLTRVLQEFVKQK